MPVGSLFGPGAVVDTPGGELSMLATNLNGPAPTGFPGEITGAGNHLAGLSGGRGSAGLGFYLTYNEGVVCRE